VGISEYPRRNKKILRNFDLLLPKFHFILPNFYFGPPWRIFVCSLEISDFLRRKPELIGGFGGCLRRRERPIACESLVLSFGFVRR